MNKVRRFILLFVAVLALCLVAGWLWLRTSLPQTSGEIALPGLAGEVTIARDRLGIPAIRAGSKEDAWFALGFVHAQDRLFQMDMMRRNGQGRLAEVIGEKALPLDRKSRGLGLYRNALKSLPGLPPAVRAALEAYSRGVNAHLASRRGALPPEFIVLGYTPEKWQPVDSLLWGRLMALWLSGNHFDELRRAVLRKTLSGTQIDDLWPPYPDDAVSGLTGVKHPIKTDLPDRSGLFPPLPAPSLPDAAARLAERVLAALPAPKGGISASNAWVLSADQTTTGSPILANDPHLWLATPGVWYLARIDAPGLHLAGATSPGVPFVVLGHNDRIAWGMTTTHSDTQDIYIERLDPGDPARYLTPDGPRPFETRRETIVVKGSEPVEMVQRTTRHGPVLSDYLDLPEEIDDLSALALDPGEINGEAGDYLLALADPGLSQADIMIAAMYGVNQARNWADFTAALSLAIAPQQTVLYADIEGNTGFYAPAKVPLRKKGDGMDPVPGWSGEYDWTGFIPFESLPHAYNPPGGRLVSANHNIVDNDYPYLLTRSWPSTYRAGYIHKRLSDRPRQSMETTAALQNDIVSPMADDLLPLLLKIEAADGAEKDALALLAEWDGTMDRRRPEPLIFSAWINEIQRLIAEDELGLNHKNMSGPRPRFIKNVLATSSPWCDDISSAVKESCDERLLEALNSALKNLALIHGDDMMVWRWGDSHAASFTSQMFKRLPFIGRRLGVTIPTDGGNHTVNRGTYILNVTGLFPGATDFPHVHGPTMRAIYDLSDLDDSLFMITPGQSGNFFSDSYDDLVTAWRDGIYVTLPKSKTFAEQKDESEKDESAPEKSSESDSILLLSPIKKIKKTSSKD